jgi:hypothetical protein
METKDLQSSKFKLQSSNKLQASKFKVWNLASGFGLIFDFWSLNFASVGGRL